jgi:hypothetical protein
MLHMKLVQKISIDISRNEYLVQVCIDYMEMCEVCPYA